MYLVVKELVAAFGGQEINTEIRAGFQGDVHKDLGGFGALSAESVLPIGSCCRKLQIGAVGAGSLAFCNPHPCPSASGRGGVLGAVLSGKCVSHGVHGAD